MGLHQTQKLLHIKGTINKTKGNLWEKIFANHISDVELICKVYIKNSHNSIAKKKNLIKNEQRGASLVAQWLRICLPMQGTWVRALVWEDPTCRGATRPVSHNY